MLPFVPIRVDPGFFYLLLTEYRLFLLLSLLIFRKIVDFSVEVVLERNAFLKPESAFIACMKGIVLPSRRIAAVLVCEEAIRLGIAAARTFALLLPGLFVRPRLFLALVALRDDIGGN